MFNYAFQMSTIVFALSMLLPLYMNKVVAERQTGLLEMATLVLVACTLTLTHVDGTERSDTLDSELSLRLHHLWCHAVTHHCHRFQLQHGHLHQHRTHQVHTYSHLFTELASSAYWAAVLLLWGHAQICTAYFWSCFVQQANRATGIHGNTNYDMY